MINLQEHGTVVFVVVWILALASPFALKYILQYCQNHLLTLSEVVTKFYKEADLFSDAVRELSLNIIEVQDSIVNRRYSPTKHPGEEIDRIITARHKLRRTFRALNNFSSYYYVAASETSGLFDITRYRTVYDNLDGRVTDMLRHIGELTTPTVIMNLKADSTPKLENL